MILIQLTGLSGAGKTTIAGFIENTLQQNGFNVSIIDGDIFRKKFCTDLGFSETDRFENLNRIIAFAKNNSANHDFIILSIINPFESVRKKIKTEFQNCMTIWVNCTLETLKKRDTKGFYQRAFLPPNDPNYLKNFTGISQKYELPLQYDLAINTDELSISETQHLISQYFSKPYQKL
ncbi:MAG: adenylyl-sulfate kinase [Pseudarcicella sp.]|nr:adenylyl-sulfate kinase [Pseudarcicella sp.]